MTREEASKTLTQYIDYDAETPDYYEMEKACKVALKALKQAPCEDCISRDAVQNYVESHIQEINTGYGDLNKHTNEILRMIVDYIESMSPVKQEPKTGHWIVHPKGIYAHIVCDKCLSNAPYDCRTNYCPNCGAKMESEDKTK